VPARGVPARQRDLNRPGFCGGRPA
jgi:hypothetical protein